MRTHWHDRENRVSIPAHEPDLPKWAWCLVANIRKEGFPGAGPLNSRGGTKHFAPRGPVVGKEKGSGRYVRKVMDWKWLENFRCKRVYSPTVISRMMGARSEIKNFESPYTKHGDWIEGWGCPEDYEGGGAPYIREEIEETVRIFQERRRREDAGRTADQ